MFLVYRVGCFEGADLLCSIITDRTSPPIRRICHPPKCFVHTRELRIFHRPARQAASEFSTQENACRHWDA